jgi:hypothetical protein
MEFTANLTLNVEVTIKAKDREEALFLLDNLYACVSLETYNQNIEEIPVVDDNLIYLEDISNQWILE